MEQFKTVIKRNFSNFVFFYRFIGYRIIVMLVLNMITGVLDGFGLAMFLPILQLVDGAETVDPEKMGKLSFLVEGFSSLGLRLNLITVLGFLCFFFILKGLIKFVATMYGVVLRQIFIRKLRFKLINGLNDINYKSFIEADAGRIQNTLTTEANSVSMAYNNYFKSLEQLVLVLVYIGFAYFIDFKFALLVTVGGLMTNLLYNRIYKYTKKASVQLTIHGHSLQRLLMQYVSNYKYLKGTGLLNKFSLQIKRVVEYLESIKRRIGFFNSLVLSIREPLLIVVVSLVILIQTEALGSPLAPILISLLFFYRALNALMGMQSSWNNFLAVSGATVNMTLFLRELKSEKQVKGSISFTAFEEKLELQGVQVSFADKTVLKDINLTLFKNDTIAFVGESGSGKSTLLNVLSGLIVPDEGEFSIDGLSSRKMRIEEYQKKIGFITQEPVIFTDTIFNNVTFWDEPNPDNLERFWQAIQKASIDDFVRGLEEKEESLLGNNGINLSGGQRQRISIARELYKNIEILIMDEATSALDSETEKSIQESIDKLKGKYTILIVAHRFSTIKNADRVVLLNNGIIKSVGSFKHLQKSEPLFKRMVELQELQ